MSRTFLLAVLVLAGTAAVTAQSSRNYGTIYSRFGLGERLSFSSSQSEMLGGAAVGLRSGTYAGIDNPALLSDQVLTQLAVSAELQGLRAEDASGDQSELTRGALGGLQLSLPLLSNRLGLTLAFRPFTRVDYLSVREGVVADPETGEETPFRNNFEGNGGLQQAKLGLGYRVAPWLAVGASVDALFGTIEYLQRTEFESTTINETRTTTETSLRGVSGTFGAVASATGLLSETDALSVGASLSLPTHLSGDRSQTLGFSLDRDTLRTEVSGDVTVPLQVVAGFSYLPDSRWTLAADVRWEPWSSFESDEFAFGGFDTSAGIDQMTDRLRVGGGVQVVPAGGRRLASYFARTAYRLGGYFDRAYFEAGITDPSAITTLALTGGVSLPALIPTARFDLGFEVGTRGTTDDGLVRDLFIKGSATINFGERWFRRRQLG